MSARAFRVCGVVLWIVATVVAIAAADPVVIVVRHAERESGKGDDPLSAAGRARAEGLAAMLRDTGVTHIFTSDQQRTRETAAPLARARQLQLAAVPLPSDNAGGASPAERQARATATAIKQLSDSDARVLVVGHSNTVPLILKALGVTDGITIADSEFDHLFVLTLHPGAAPQLLRLRY